MVDGSGASFGRASYMGSQVATVPFSQLKGGGLLTAAGPLRPNSAALGAAGLLIGRGAAPDDRAVGKVITS